MLSLQLNKDNSLIGVLHRFIDVAELKISKKEIKDALLEHPSYPNLFSLSDVLTSYNIKNQPARIEADQLSKLEPYSFAQVLGEGMVLVHEVTEEKIAYYGEINGWTEESIEAFNTKWNGIIVLTDWKTAREEITTSNAYSFERISKWRNWIATSLAITLVALLGWQLTGGPSIWLFVSSLLGLSISTFLVLLGLDQAKYKKYCQMGGGFDCTSVLNSSYAKVNNWFTLADLSLVYFSGSVLVLSSLAIAGLGGAVITLEILALMGLVLSGYSIYLQAFVIRKWCIYCLGIVGILLFQAGFSAYWLLNTPVISLSIGQVGLVGLLFSIPLIGWTYLQPLLIENTKNSLSKIQYHRLKRSKEIFTYLQNQQKQVQVSWPSSSILLGDPEATHELCLILNPFCDACAEEYISVYELINKAPKKLRLNIIFATGSNPEVTAKLFDLYKELPQDVFKDVLLDWYKDQDPETLENKYGLAYSDHAKQRVQEHANWLQLMNVIRVPVVYLDRKALSGHYSIDDLSYVL